MTAAEREVIEIVIISRDNYIVFRPLLPEVISGSVALNHVISPVIRRLAKPRGSSPGNGEAIIDLANRTSEIES